MDESHEPNNLIDNSNYCESAAVPKCPPRAVPRKKKISSQTREVSADSGYIFGSSITDPMANQNGHNVETVDLSLQCNAEPSMVSIVSSEENIMVANPLNKKELLTHQNKTAEAIHQNLSSGETSAIVGVSEAEDCGNSFKSSSQFNVSQTACDEDIRSCTESSDNSQVENIDKNPKTFTSASISLSRSASLPQNPNFQRLDPKPVMKEKHEREINSLSKISEESYDVSAKRQPLRKPPPPKPKTTPPHKPKIVPPLPPPPSHRSGVAGISPTSPSHYTNSPPLQDTNVTSVVTEKTPPSAKPVGRKESASKRIDLLKKKGMQFKEKSKKVFKSRTSQGDHDDLEDRTKIDGMEPVLPESVTINQNRQAEIKPLPTNKSSPSCVEKSKRAPPPRPALPSVLKNRRASEPPLHLSDSISVQDCTSTLSPVNDSTEVFGEATFTSKTSANVSLLKSGDDVLSENFQVQKPPKPARPPPIQLSDSTMIVMATRKKPENPKDNDDASILDLLKEKKDDKCKPEVDEKMKDYFSGELYCIAVDDYESTNFTDISFKAGERIFVMRQLDDEILFGRNENGEEGPFPGKYVRIEDS